MSRVIILHGRPDEQECADPQHPSASNDHWIAWLQKQLVIAGHNVQTPEIFDPRHSPYAEWRQEFERHLVDDPMILIGHSRGAGFLVRWLSEHENIQVEKLVLVAASLVMPVGAHETDFFDFEIDQRLDERVEEFHIFHSSDDTTPSIPESAEILKQHFPNASWHTFNSMGHFCIEDMDTQEFPDLRDAIIG